MKTICLYFEIHQMIHLKRYRFFDIGTDHYYYDDYENERTITDIVNRSYMPALETLHEMIRRHGHDFNVAFSLSGVGMEQLELHAPQILTKLQEINESGCVEFLAEPYSHGLSSLANRDTFVGEVKRQAKKIEEYFGKKPTVLRNSSLVYDDDIGEIAAEMGFVGMLTEGARHILGWKSPHYVYHCATNPKLKIMLRDFVLSDDISLRFSNPEWEGYPLFADNLSWLNLVLLGLLPTAFSNITLVVSIKQIGSTLYAILGAFEPFTAMCVGILVFDEPLTPQVIIGFSLILLSVGILIMRSPKTDTSSDFRPLKR